MNRTTYVQTRCVESWHIFFKMQGFDIRFRVFQQLFIDRFFKTVDLLLVNEKMYVFIKIVFIALFCYRANRNSAAAS